MKDCIEHTSKALSLVRAEELLNPVRSGVVLPLDGKDGVHVLGFMPCYLADAVVGDGNWWQPGPPGPNTKKGSGGYICSKVITVFPSNVGSGYDGHQGVVLLYSASTGSLVCIADAHEITGVRTAAASAVATRLLAKEGPCVLCLLGSGFQAVKHLEAIKCVREIVEVRVWSRTKERAEAFATSAGILVSVFDSAEEAVRGADIVCTLTPATSPILQHSWLKAGAHINAVGSCHPCQQELDEECIVKGRVFCDTIEGCLQGLTRTGDLVKPIEADIFSAGSITELASVLESGKGRGNADEVTVFKSVGFAIEDLCSAVALYESVRKQPDGTFPTM